MSTEENPVQKKFKWWLWIPVGLFAIFMLIGISQSNNPEVTEKFRQKDVIEYCWKEQGRKSLDPSAARLAASYCEKMEDDFRKRWGVNP